MRVLVTGAAGFIGSHLADRLVSDGHEVAGLDDMSGGANERPGVDLWRMDVAAPALADRVKGFGPEVVCHLAAQVSVRRSVEDPRHDARVNVLGTANVLEAALRAGSRKVVFTSSCAVYGVPDALPVPNDAPLRPASPYAASKVTGEVYAGMYRRLHGLDFTTLALANVYGPRQTPEGEAGVISIFTDALLAGRPTRVFGDGTQTRDYVYVLDVVDAFARAAGEAGGGGRFNVGTGRQTTDRDLHALVAGAAGAPDDPAFAPPRLGDLPAMAVDPSATERDLGWTARTPLAEGLAATVAWARSRTT
ncbi:NAD-dependent epimerase/dehydratase family protein [Actinomadura parmotrematis]|uniref:NAD-dependent epimerase/dehydratase family protein n=1 Tax=Actinomadura parmotrematis TaxID=2864039 RepID=A0ABS7G1K0_9ACTN|nr:NAD-dependent epimerase/dehydratase family protein [Actinomadura parmotrematis]MBW8486265.1 NAD-dependent epimerase/dehydratase family protein [Actinomadura parmotrematis]